MASSLIVVLASLLAIGSAIPFEFHDHDPDCPYPETGVAVYYPDVNDCSKFYECSQGKKVHQSCPKGLLWDVTKNTCANDWEVDCSQLVSTTEIPPVLTTSKRPEPTTPEPTTRAPTIPTANPTSVDPSNLCENVATGTYLPYPGDKKKYIECVNHHTIVYTCPGITFWDQSVLNCI